MLSYHFYSAMESKRGIFNALLVLCCFMHAVNGVIDGEFEVKFTDCNEVRESGRTQSGVYTLWHNKTSNFKVHCHHEANNSYTVILRRTDGSVNFVQPWHMYVSGFGNPQSDYWAGLSHIYYLTSTGNNVLTVYMQDWHGNNRNVRYSHFKLMDPTYFHLSIEGFSGQVIDDLSYNNNMRFATYDSPDVNNCAVHQQAGWWYNYCTYALPTGKYYLNGPYTPSHGFYDGMYWKDWFGYGYSLKFISMSLSRV